MANATSAKKIYKADSKRDGTSGVRNHLSANTRNFMLNCSEKKRPKRRRNKKQEEGAEVKME